MDDLNAEHRRILARAEASVAAAAPRAAADPTRPIYHVASPAYWINDPNGPVYVNGEYHLFFQHNPFGSDWGNMCWGHVVSRDLVRWAHLPIALAPGPGEYDAGGVFSGCCVVDGGVPTIVYTGVAPECQCVATSADGLRSWTKHPANPVIAAPPRDDLVGFRDPFCWRDGAGWYMALGSGVRDEGGCVLLYRSPDLRRWDYAGPLCSGPGEMLECPTFFPLGEKWVLCVSPYGQVIYAIGTFADRRFHPETEWRPMDLGGRDDFYAPNCTLDPQGRRVLWGWVHAGRPEGHWNGVLTLPRVLSLRPNGRLGIEPLPELARLRGRHERRAGIPIASDASVVAAKLPRDAAEIRLEIRLRGAQVVGLTIGNVPCGHESITIAYDHRRGLLGCAERVGAFRLLPEEEALRLRVFVDRSVVEVYANGRAALTARSDAAALGGRHPDREDRHPVTLFANGGPARVDTVDVWEMTSIWGARAE